MLIHFKYAVDGSNRGPPRFVHKATPARLMRRARSSHNYHGRRLGAIDAVNEWRLPKVSEEEDEAVDQNDWQADTVSSRISSGIGLNLLRPVSSSAKYESGSILYVTARDWNFEPDGVYEENNQGGRAFGNSDGEDCPVAVQRMERRLRGSAVKPKENFVQAKLVAWKDAQITKLIDK